MIDVVIGKDGAIKDARVVASAPTAERLKELEPKKGTPAATEGDARLAEAALDAVKQWRYAPILEGRQAGRVQGHRDRELQARLRRPRAPPGRSRRDRPRGAFVRLRPSRGAVATAAAKHRNAREEEERRREPVAAARSAVMIP